MSMKEVDTMLKRLCSLIALAPLTLASFAGTVSYTHLTLPTKRIV